MKMHMDVDYYSSSSLKKLFDKQRLYEQDELPKKTTIFLSYCEKDSVIANMITSQLRRETNNGLEIERYTRIPYKGSFKAFMNSIQEHDFVLCIVSDNYLKSQACMYEVGEIIKDHNFEKKLLFVIIGENDAKYYSDNKDVFAVAKIYGNERNRLAYVRYWKDEYEKLKKAIEDIDDPEAIIRASEDLREIGKIYRNDISEFLTYLAQNKGKNFEELYADGFSDIIKWIFPRWESKRFKECKDMGTLLMAAIKEVCNLTKTDYNQIALSVSISRHETGLVVYADNIQDGKQRYRLVIMEGVMGRSFSTGEIINIDNTKNSPQYFNAVNETKSELVMPIEFQGNVVGVINSESEKENYYSTELVKKMFDIANDLSISMQKLGFIPNMRANEIPYIHI